MKKLTGTLKITIVPESGGIAGHFALIFVPYVGRLDTRVVKMQSHDALTSFLIDLRLPEDDATRWAGKARAEGIVLISPFERTDEQLREHGLLG